MLAINWELKEIYPRYADLLSTLDHLFKGQPHLRQNYKTGFRYYKGQRARFRRHDREHGTKWETHVANRLFALGRQQIDLATKLRKFDFKNAWLIQNCRPSGGKWTGSAFYGQRNPTGKQCGSSLCIWCWMRRLDDLSNMIRSDGLIKTRSKMKSCKSGLGLKNPVCISCFTVIDEKVVTTRAYRSECLYRLNKFVRHVPHEIMGMPASTGTLREFSKAMRVTTPVMVKNALKMQISYIHQGPALTPKALNLIGKNCSSGLIELNRCSDLSIWESLRLAYPFPAWIYHPDTSVNDVHKFYQAVQNLKMYGITDMYAPQPGVELSTTATEEQAEICLRYHMHV